MGASRAPLAPRAAAPALSLLRVFPDPFAPPPGCAFAPRCPRAVPPLEPIDDPARLAACYRPLDANGAQEDRDE